MLIFSTVSLFRPAMTRVTFSLTLSRPQQGEQLQRANGQQSFRGAFLAANLQVRVQRLHGYYPSCTFTTPRPAALAFSVLWLLRRHFY
ncbi:hypothetical protein B0H16DRAFT_1585496 [Mycena metata]|uniref:Uncharacterized protein n=1 Tax=Mycena metata TaxID=1033252 RepID=A0AAD7HX12_9AGAR|nr:hypothetical protein B0H16DRAFT_1585496 [Mycena metata]